MPHEALKEDRTETKIVREKTSLFNSYLLLPVHSHPSKINPTCHPNVPPLSPIATSKSSPPPRSQTQSPEKSYIAKSEYLASGGTATMERLSSDNVIKTPTLNSLTRLKKKITNGACAWKHGFMRGSKSIHAYPNSSNGIHRHAVLLSNICQMGIFATRSKNVLEQWLLTFAINGQNKQPKVSNFFLLSMSFTVTFRPGIFYWIANWTWRYQISLARPYPVHHHRPSRVLGIAIQAAFGISRLVLGMIYSA